MPWSKESKVENQGLGPFAEEHAQSIADKLQQESAEATLKNT